MEERIKSILKSRKFFWLVSLAVFIFLLISIIFVYAISKYNQQKQDEDQSRLEEFQSEKINEETVVDTPLGICELAIEKTSIQKLDDKNKKITVSYSIKFGSENKCLDPIKELDSSIGILKFDTGSEVKLPIPETTEDKIIFDLSQVEKQGKGKLFWQVQYENGSNLIEIANFEITFSKTDPKVEPPGIPTKNKYEVKVLSLSYFPIKEGKLDTSIVNNSWGEYNMTLAQVRGKVSTTQSELISSLEQGSRYRAYRDNSSPISVDYNIYNSKEYQSAVPISTKPNPWDGSVHMTDYKKILLDHDICNLVEHQGVKEVWLWSYTGIGRSGWESNFSSRYGDISNSDRDSNDMPVCGKSYTIYEYNYGRGTSEAMEDHMHQFEAIFRYVDSNLFWNKFVGYHPSSGTYSINTNRRCGWAHYPPNGIKDYDWTNQSYVQTDCMDWNPDSLGEIKNINCSQWGCESRKFFIFWMQSIPGYGNTITYQNKQLKNWWSFIADFDNEMNKGRNLTY